MKKFLLLVVRWAISAGGVAAAAWIIPGISVTGQHRVLTVVVVAVVLGLVNALIRPLLAVVSCGLIVLTLGLFTLVINGLMLWLASWICTHWLSVGFRVDGLWAAVLGAIVISVFSFLVSTFVGTGKRR